MGNKKHRNKGRNERKAALRTQLVDAQNKAHDANLAARMFMAGTGQMTEQVLMSDLDTSAIEDPYSLARVIEAAKEYRKLDPNVFFMATEVQYADDDNDFVNALGYCVCIYANKPDGPVVLTKTKHIFDDPEKALQFASKDLPIVAVKVDDEVSYPAYSEAKGKAMASARDRRNKRMAKVIENLNTLVSVGSFLGGI